MKPGEYHFVLTMEFKVGWSGGFARASSTGTVDVKEEQTRQEITKDLIAALVESIRTSVPQAADGGVVLFLSIEPN